MDVFMAEVKTDRAYYARACCVDRGDSLVIDWDVINHDTGKKIHKQDVVFKRDVTSIRKYVD